MKNIDKIRAMSAEELAKIFTDYSVSICSDCIVPIDFCSKKPPIACQEIIADWLNQEINPMPKLEVGDVLETGSDGCRYYYIGNDEAVRTIDTLRSQDLPIVRRCVSDIQGDIVKIWRDNDNSLLLGARRFDVIWRAGNE